MVMRDLHCRHCKAMLPFESLVCENCGRSSIATGAPGAVLALYLLIGGAALLFVTFCVAR
jgi:hypothetical protein